MNKKMFIVTFVFLMGLFNSVSAMYLTPVDFLKNISEINRENRLYFGKSFLTLGLPIMGSSVFMNDSSNKKAALFLGGVYSSIGGGFLLFESKVESKYKSLIKNSDKTPLELIKEIRDSERADRYIIATITALPLLFNFSSEKTTSNPNPEDANYLVKSFFGGMSLSLLLHQSSLEKICNSIITNNSKKNISFQVQPSFQDVKILMAYDF